jgi:hypothetical protein
VTGLEGGLVCGRWSLCWWRSATKAVPAGWAEGRQASPGYHRPGWRCVDRRGIAKDSSRQTCCVAEANAGGRWSVGGRIWEQAKVIAEHGVAVAASSEQRVRVSVAGGSRRRAGQSSSEGGSRRRRQRGLIGGGGGTERSGRRRGVCVSVRVDSRMRGRGRGKAMQCNAALGVGYVGVVAIFGRSADY